MKKRWIIFGVSGLMLIVIVAGVLVLLHFSMASTVGRRKEFCMSGGFSDSAVGSGGESFRDSTGDDGKLKEQPQQDTGWGNYNNMYHHGQHNGYYDGGDARNDYSNSNDCYGNGCALDDCYDMIRKK